VATPNGSGGYNRLLGVAAVAPDDVWAVGEDGSNTLSLHWNGSAWKIVATPTPNGNASLRAVSAASASDIWAVGDSGAESLTLRWTGKKWKTVPSPSPGTHFLDLNGVSARAPDDAWAVGFYDESGHWKTLTMHWDGKAWQVVDSPEPDPELNVLNGVSAAGPGEVFAVGSGGSTGTLALRYRDGAWKIVKSANDGTADNFLSGISGSSPTDLWAVGRSQHRSLTLHSDGSKWKVVPSPNLEHGIELEDVVSLAQDDAWAVGSSENDLDTVNVALHWNGQKWSIVPTPQPGGDGLDRLSAVDAAGPDDVWAVGTYEGDQVYDRSLVLHWDGNAWSVVSNPCDTPGGLTGITVLSASDIWAVGNATTCHYDGSSWTYVPSPQPHGDEIGYPLEDVSGSSPTDVWAVGARAIEYDETVVFSSIAEHWDGSQWTLVTDVPGQILYGVEALAPKNVWAVGSDSFGPLIVHYGGSGWKTTPTPEQGRGGQLSAIDRVRSRLWAAGSYSPDHESSRTLVTTAPSTREGAVVGSTAVAGATITWLGPEKGTTTTDEFGDYQAGGLRAGCCPYLESPVRRVSAAEAPA